MDKKREQLGMHPSTATHRLLRDILFKFIVEANHKCFRCNKDLNRHDFSVEHKEDWLDSKDPKDKFFDLDNIAFSHRSCNYSAARKSNKKYHTHEKLLEGKAAERKRRRGKMTPEQRKSERRDRYLRYGK